MMSGRLLLVAVLLVTAATARWRVQAVEPAPAVELASLPNVLEEWTGRATPPLDAATLDVLKADDYVTRVYESAAGGGVGLFVAYYRSQESGSTIHSPLNCLPGAGWQPVQAERVPFGARGAVRRVLIQKGEEQQLVLYWYQTAARIEGDEYRSKVFLVLDAMRLRLNNAALVRLVAPIDRRDPDAIAKADRSLLRMAELAEPQISALLFR